MGGKNKTESTNVLVDAEDRGNWDNQCDFFLSCLGFAVGLGNVWRFPYLCYQHGGGSFLIAYATCLLLAGLPLFFLELAIGQYGGLGPNKLFGRIAPAFKGLGYGMLFISFLVVIYYNMIIAWTLFYTFAGFTSQLPWEFCGNDYNSLTCYNNKMAQDCLNTTDLESTYYNNTCTSIKTICKEYGYDISENVDVRNESYCYNGTHEIELYKVYKRVPPSEDYYNRVVLGLEDGTTWENVGPVRWELALSLLGAWLIVGLCLIKGVQSSGKVVYFTALFPYLVLLILLIRGVTLDGAYDGIMFYLNPRIENLKNVQLWSDAATQIFYSLGPSFGGLITLASYNRFDNNCHRDAIIIAFSNCGTSVFAGFVIFSIIGFMAHEQGVEVDDVIASGPGLAFIAYPEAVTKLPLSPLWSFLFFMMLITLGLDSQFTMTETITTALMDQWPQLRPKKSLVVITACVLGFLLGLTMCTNGGVYMFQLINWYSASWSLLIISITELMLLMYVYGVNNVFDNITEMGIRLPVFMKWYWKACWCVITPVILTLILIATWAQYTPCEYGDYVFPNWVQAIGWLMAATAVVIVPIFFGIEYMRRKKAGKLSGILDMFRPSDKWGPARPAIKPMSQGQLKAEEAYTNEGYNYNSTHM